MPNTCAYCGHTTKLTKEHLFPDFFKKYFYDSAVILDVQTFHNPPLNPLELTVNDVCKACNNDTLSNLDRYGQRIIKQIINNPEMHFQLYYTHSLLTQWLCKICYNAQRLFNWPSFFPTESIHLYAGRISGNQQGLIGTAQNMIGINQIKIDEQPAYQIWFHSVLFILSKTPLTSSQCCNTGVTLVSPESNQILLELNTSMISADTVRYQSTVLFPKQLNEILKTNALVPSDIQMSIDTSLNIHIQSLPLPLSEAVIRQHKDQIMIILIPFSTTIEQLYCFESSQHKKRWSKLIQTLLNGSKEISITYQNDHTQHISVKMINQRAG